MKRVFFLIALVVSGIFAADAQTQNPVTVSGKVTDPNGAVIVGAQVMVSGAGLRQNTITDQEGSYRFQNLPNGEYEIKVTAEGFAANNSVVLRFQTAAEILISRFESAKAA